MLTCSVCGHQNDDLATVCSSCKGFLQAKVDGLNLFQTIWGLMETPGGTFRRIVLSRIKNYIFLLSSLFGIAAALGFAWYRNLGKVFTSLLTLVGTGILVGPLLGILLVALGSILLVFLSSILGGKPTVRNMFAVVSYSAVPVILSLVFVFPIELAIFGPYLFDNNPPPLVLNPVLYIALLGFDVIAVCWSCYLLWKGNIVVSGFRRGKALLVTLGLVALTGAGVYVLRYV